MKIAWIQDINPFTAIGGAQLTDLAHIKYGFGLGYDIDIITPQEMTTRRATSDVIVISNCMNFTKEFILHITKEMPYVMFHHDYNFCNHRLFFPLDDKCKCSVNKSFWSEIIGKAKLNIFLSPLHREMYYRMFTPEVVNPSACIPSAINTELFKKDETVQTKSNTVLGIHCLLPFKGRYNIYNYMKEHPELFFTFVGNQQEVNASNCKYIQYLPNEDLPKLYSEHEYFIHLPSTPQPFERTVAEAYLCGCKIIKNDLVGAFSYPWDFNNREEVRKILSQASVGFWEEIEKVVKNPEKEKLKEIAQ